ncbi:hypothetical protein SAMN04490201_2163 [Pseudomonas psychrophila]|uniref:Uncharacterized protein n=1 Tax=Pseudomonas psychrophila TaxID=122355 RepID=A0ABY0VRF2_9PSED|nr:hypothetical protein SAMN04490201_2163 [Pseudomonas psychrophila]
MWLLGVYKVFYLNSLMGRLLVLIMTGSSLLYAASRCFITEGPPVLREEGIRYQLGLDWPVIARAISVA